jgi:hypothetical protein
LGAALQAGQIRAAYPDGRYARSADGTAPE